MKIEIIKCLKDNYSYVVIDKENNSACVIDPSESKPIIDYAEKNKLNLKFILNTHHHFDHVGGNKDLKKKYNSKVIGFKKDKNRIPEMDISLDDKDVWKHDKFEAKIYHIPGHTSGHVCYHFFKQHILFTGDTLFSLGCGRIFEGTYEEMFSSLQLIKSFPEETKIYCGHEYTLKNSEFCIKYDENNSALRKKIRSVKTKLEKSIPTIPSTIKEELDCNIFLRSKDVESFSKLRDLKDNF
jgi:hydroxyacylglutathione hydrolase